VLTLKDSDPPQSHTLRWDDRQLVLLDPQQKALLTLPPGEAVYRIDMEEFFGKKVGLKLDDDQTVVFNPDVPAWQDVKALLEKHLRSDENLRYHVRAANRQTFWLGLGLVLGSVVAAFAIVLYFAYFNEPKAGIWKFMHRFGLKIAFIILFGLAWAGISLWLASFRGSRLVKHATREDVWYRP
jgi:hypothetical protein